MHKLKDVLDGKRKCTENDLRNNKLQQLVTSYPEKFYDNKYLSSREIRSILVKLHSEIEANERKIFGPGTFVGLQGRLNCTILLKYILEDKLRWDFAVAVQKINYKILYSMHLRSVKEVFETLYDALTMAYPERNLKPYYFRRHKNVWIDPEGNIRESRVREAIREFIRIYIARHNGVKLKNIPKWISYRIFQQNLFPYGANLSYMLSICFGNSPIKAVMFAYPEMDLKPHYFSHVPKGFWKGQQGTSNAKHIMNELFSRLTDPAGPYKFEFEEAKNLFKYKTYLKPLLPHGKRLSGMLQARFRNSPSKPLELVDHMVESDSS